MKKESERLCKRPGAIVLIFVISRLLDTIWGDNCRVVLVRGGTGREISSNWTQASPIDFYLTQGWPTYDQPPSPLVQGTNITLDNCI